MKVDCVREMTVKKSSKYGKYGSFEHWLYLSWCCFASSASAILSSADELTSSCSEGVDDDNQVD